MPTPPLGLVLDADDLAAARRCAHEALVLAVGDLDGVTGAAADAGRRRVLALAGAVHALGTETDGDGLLVLVGAPERDALAEGAREVEADMRAASAAAGSLTAGGGRHAPTLRAARRVRAILGDGGR